MSSAGTTWLRRVGDRALDLVFPPSCVICHVLLEEASDGIALCEHCRAALPRIAWATCRRCAARVPEIPGSTPDCKHCRDHRLQFDRTLALGVYDGMLRDLVLEMKQDATGRLMQALGRLIVLQWGDALRALEPDVIVPIPRHAWRRLSRRADPPAALAATLGRRLHVSVRSDLLRWRRDPSAQVGLSQPGRFRNMHGAMQVRRGYRLDAPRVLVVDDTMTTGATCSEAARALKRAGAAQVTAVVVGRTTGI